MIKINNIYQEIKSKIKTSGLTHCWWKISESYLIYVLLLYSLHYVFDYLIPTLSTLFQTQEYYDIASQTNLIDSIMICILSKEKNSKIKM